MDRQADIRRVGAHFQREADLGDQVARVRADNATAQDPPVLPVEQELGEALIATERQRLELAKPMFGLGKAAQ